MKAKMLFVGLLSVVVSQAISARLQSNFPIFRVTVTSKTISSVNICSPSRKCSGWTESYGVRLNVPMTKQEIIHSKYVTLMYKKGNSVSEHRLPFSRELIAQIENGKSIDLVVEDEQGRVVAVDSNGTGFVLQASHPYGYAGLEDNV